MARRCFAGIALSQLGVEPPQGKVAGGEASSIAEALDAAIYKVRRLENRERLAAATARFFDKMEAHTAAEEDAIAHDIASAASAIDVDQEL